MARIETVDDDEASHPPTKDSPPASLRRSQHPPHRSTWGWIFYLVAFLLTLYASLKLAGLTPGSKIVHAERYSDKFKFRPAASPIITETLKDGRTLLRGAEPTTRGPLWDKPKSTGKPKKRTRKRRKYGNSRDRRKASA